MPLACLATKTVSSVCFWAWLDAWLDSKTGSMLAARWQKKTEVIHAFPYPGFGKRVPGLMRGRGSMRLHKFIMAILGLCQALPAYAGGDDRLDQLLSLSLEELMALETTIATNVKQTLARTPSVVTVITSEDI